MMNSRISRLKGNRFFTIVLGIAAIAIWFRIALHIADPTDVLSEHPAKAKELTSQNFRDSIAFKLDLNYEDPFRVSGSPDATKLPPSTVLRKSKVVLPAKAPDILYFGSMINGYDERKVLVKYQGKYYYASVNDTIGTFLLKKVHKDSIMLVSGKQVFHARRRYRE